MSSVDHVQEQAVISISTYSSRSIVIRSNPIEFLKDRISLMESLYCKWNPSLKSDPEDPSKGRVPGWICSSKREQHVRQTLKQLDNVAMGSIDTSSVPSTPLTPIRPTTAINSMLGVTPSTHRTVTHRVPVPTVGGGMFWRRDGISVPVTVHSVDDDTATIQTSDGDIVDMTLDGSLWVVDHDTRQVVDY